MKYVFKRNLDDESAGCHLISIGIEFKTGEAEKTSHHQVDILCISLLRRDMVFELEQVLQEYDGY